MRDLLVAYWPIWLLLLCVALMAAAMCGFFERELRRPRREFDDVCSRIDLEVRAHEGRQP